MTIESNISKNTYTGNGQTTIFPFTYKIWKENEIEVILENEKGITSIIVPYAVTINKNGGGEVVLYLDNENKTPIPQGYKIALTRNMPFLQEQDYLNGGRFNAEVVEDNFDIACAERQELKEKVGRAVIMPPTSSKTPEQILQDFLLKYNDVLAKYPEIINAFVTIYPRIEDVLKECIANKDLAHAWAEGSAPPDPNNPESKSSREWAMIAADILPIATDTLLGKVKGGGNILIAPDGTLNFSPVMLETINNSITALQTSKLDKSALSDDINSESGENAASSAAVKKVNDKIRTDSQITALCMPDYSAGIDISWASSSNMFTAPCDGIINWIGKLSTGAFINGYGITGITSLEHSVHDRTFFMPKGALFYANAYQHNGGYNNKFFPLKGASK